MRKKRGKARDEKKGEEKRIRTEVDGLPEQGVRMVNLLYLFLDSMV